MRFELPGYAEDRARRRAGIPELMAAASSGNVEAQLALAWEYARGDVVDLDIISAWNWFDRAAASGQEEALLHRSRFLQLRGVPQGVRDLRKLAAEGNWKAQFWLARFYQSQHGRLNQLRSVVWYDRSFRRGNRGARFAKFAQLARISKWLSKFMFATIAFVEAVSLIIYISKRNDQIELYETLLYRVKRKST
jgi:TPR repeat protein